MTDEGEAPPVRFRTVPRATAGGAGNVEGNSEIDRYPAVAAELRTLLSGCQEIIDRGQTEFLSTESQLTSLAADALIIHFSDPVKERLPSRVKVINHTLPWREITHTRNIVAHQYLRADPRVIWNVVSRSLPDAIRQILASVPPATP